MTQAERRLFLIKSLIAENPLYGAMGIPDDENKRKELLRALMNVRNPAPISDEFIKVQNEYLQQAIAEKGITDINDLSPVADGIWLWQGDITTLRCDAIVNAANSGMLGCFRPLHNCIDNCIHTFAGVQLRNTCAQIMQEQGTEEPTGRAKITPAFNLPCKYVIHTVGPIVRGRLTNGHRDLLRSCYRSCLEIANKYKLESIAFCCVSTGVFMFPNDEAAEIAVDTVRKFLENETTINKVVFNVFKDVDLDCYNRLLK